MAPQLVLITGVTGYVGSTVAYQALSQGFHVRGAIRRAQQETDFRKRWPQFESQLSFVVVGALDAPNNFDEAMKGVDAVIHTASPTFFNPQDNERDILSPAINGTSSILKSAARESTVKQFVLTSSTVAYMDLLNPKDSTYTYTSEDWNPMTYEEAAAQPAEGGGMVYSASKAIAEKFAWDFVKNNDVSFTLTTIAPSWNVGFDRTPTLWKASDARSTYGMQAAAILDVKELGGEFSAWFVYVGDVAKAHVGALVKHEVAAGKRYIVSGGRMSNPLIASLVKKNFPEQAHRLPEVATADLELPPLPRLYTSPAEIDFGFKYKSLEESLKEQFEQYFALPV